MPRDDEQARELARLRWQCRRGMLELDEILRAYVDTRYPGASAGELAAFRHLLDYQDPELQQWLLLDREPENEDLRAIVTLLRDGPGA